MKNTINWPTVAVVAIITVFATMQSRAGRPQFAPPAVIATVDLEQVMTSMDAYKESNVDLEALGASLDAREEELRQEISDLQEDLGFLPPGSANSLETQREIHWLAQRRTAFLEFASRKINVEHSKVLRSLYDQVLGEVDRMAAENGYDVVLVNDSASELPDRVSERDMMRAIASRRILKAASRIDITQELVQRLNS